MKSVYEAATSLDAHMILNLLEQQGIAGRVEGEYLQGGVGELQAMNIVRVVVDEADYGAARDVIRTWETTQPEPEPSGATATKRPVGVVPFLVGVIVGMGGMYWLCNAGSG